MTRSYGVLDWRLGSCVRGERISGSRRVRRLLFNLRKRGQSWNEETQKRNTRDDTCLYGGIAADAGDLRTYELVEQQSSPAAFVHERTKEYKMRSFVWLGLGVLFC